MRFFTILLLSYLIVTSCSQPASEKPVSGYPISPVSFQSVEVLDDFWSKKIKTNHDVTIPIAVQKSQESGRIKNFKIAGGLAEGGFCSIYPFDDSDIYKIIEAASYSLQTFPDPAMEVMIDSLIDFIAAAQEPDGYLYTNRTIGKPVHEWAGSQRWELVHDLSHELYNLGHMYEAAVAHYEATGKRSLLEVAIKSADLVDDVFGPSKLEDYPGHQEIEIGLVKLYRATGDEKYLNLAKFFLDVRGKPGVGQPKTYDQSHIPVVDQREAVGHSVRATYMWTAMADIAAITGDTTYTEAIKAIWNDVVGTKYYINGGIGATGNHEGFDDPFVLPNMTAYCETCAGVGNALWNHRMFLMTGESKYIDVLERTMYNNILDGVSLSGDHFFYPNPLASNGQHARSEWFGCACCPPNVSRFLPSMPGYIYAQKRNDLYVNLYVSSQTTFLTGNSEVEISQQSGFPWQGNVELRVKSEKESNATIHLRVPGYINGQPAPGGLYSYLNETKPSIELMVNGQIQEFEVDKAGYIQLEKSWKDDLLQIKFPFEVHKIKARPEVTADLEKYAVERGPLLYCVEWPDVPNGKALGQVFDENQIWSPVQSQKLGGIIALSGESKTVRKTLDGQMAAEGIQTVQLIPYHLWNNRGAGEMSVWLPYTQDAVTPVPAPTIVYQSNITTSENKRSYAIKDQLLPSSSSDQANSIIHWWPKKDTTEWVQFDFDQVKSISGVKVYWFDDGPDGGCRIPASWVVKYKKGDAWLPVQAKYDVKKDEWNQVDFKSVKTQSVRLELQLPKEYASGIHEVEIY